ncbi:hypothetical protein DFH29DRAFT_891810 [Suillus ampliporus]|nr:hypothetical protein DFH29DRAFT_891810 [Suillus ampliporus]
MREITYSVSVLHVMHVLSAIPPFTSLPATDSVQAVIHHLYHCFFSALVFVPYHRLVPCSPFHLYTLYHDVPLTYLHASELAPASFTR